MSDKAARIHDMEMALRAALASVRPEAHLSWKAMFGGAGFFVEGRIFAAWFGEGLALKLAEVDRHELLQVDGAQASQSAQYIEVPDRFLDNPTLLEPWVKRSVDYVLSQPSKKRGKA